MCENSFPAAKIVLFSECDNTHFEIKSQWEERRKAFNIKNIQKIIDKKLAM